MILKLTEKLIKQKDTHNIKSIKDDLNKLLERMPVELLSTENRTSLELIDKYLKTVK